MKRVGKVKLGGKVVGTIDTPKDGKLVGSLSGQFDATGFASGCELAPGILSDVHCERRPGFQERT